MAESFVAHQVVVWIAVLKSGGVQLVYKVPTVAGVQRGEQVAGDNASREAYKVIVE